MIVSRLVNLMVERLYSFVVMQIWLAMLYCFKIIASVLPHLRHPRFLV